MPQSPCPAQSGALCWGCDHRETLPGGGGATAVVRGGHGVPTTTGHSEQGHLPSAAARPAPQKMFPLATGIWQREGCKLGSRSPFLPWSTADISQGAGTLEMCCGSEELSYFSWVVTEFRGGHFVPVFPQRVVETQNSSTAGLYTPCSRGFTSPQGSVQRLHFPKNTPFARQELCWLWQ